MPERIAKLRATLQELEAELSTVSGPELDEQTRAQLEETILELRSALAKQPADLESETIAARLTSSAEAFEVSHPTLFAIVSRTADALARMGI